MRLGIDTGSATNYLQARATRGQPDPVVGMGATVLHWSDRSAATIVEVFDIRGDVAVTCQVDRAIRTDANGLSEDQEHRYEPNPQGDLHTFRRAKDGKWKPVFLNAGTKRWNARDGGGGLRIGERDAYCDPSF